MDNTPDSRQANSAIDPEEQQRQNNWRELQIALGLDSDELAATVAPPNAPPPPAAPPQTRMTRREPEPAPTFGGFGAGLNDDIGLPAASGESRESREPEPEASRMDAEPSSDDQEVEVGEAPEEVPDEPGEGEAADKKRRRRRRRRRRDETTAEPTANGEAPAAPVSAGEVNAEAEDEEDDSADDVEDDDEEEIEPLRIPDWDVPTWQELIASLYRPER